MPSATGALKPGARVPSTRDLARQLGISRRVAVDAYEQLAAEGYLHIRQGARPRVAETACCPMRRGQPWPRPEPRPRFDFSPSVPDVSAFPRSAWLRSLREALASITDGDLGYGDPRGVNTLRVALADYLGRVREVVAEPERVVVTSGYTQGLGLVCHAWPRDRCANDRPRRAEQPGPTGDRGPPGLRPIPLDVDDPACASTSSNAPERTRSSCPRTPASDRRAAQRRAAHGTDRLASPRDAIAIEDDYDADYRYDAPPPAHCRVSNHSESSTPDRPARRSRRPCGSVGSSCHHRWSTPSARRSFSLTGERPASSSSPSLTSSGG